MYPLHEYISDYYITSNDSYGSKDLFRCDDDEVTAYFEAMAKLSKEFEEYKIGKSTNKNFKDYCLSTMGNVSIVFYFKRHEDEDENGDNYFFYDHFEHEGWNQTNSDDADEEDEDGSTYTIEDMFTGPKQTMAEFIEHVKTFIHDLDQEDKDKLTRVEINELLSGHTDVITFHDQISRPRLDSDSSIDW